MVRQKLFFLAPLANVDESILNAKLPGGFGFSRMSFKEGSSLIAKLEKFSPENFFQWRHIHTVPHNDNLFFIEKSFDFDLPENQNGEIVYCHELYAYVVKSVNRDIEIPLQLFRLFKEGNIHFVCWYIFHRNDDNPKIILAGGGISSSQDQILLHFEDSEIEAAQKFVETIKIPTQSDYLALAHSNYELSFKVQDSSLAFLTLMIAMEVLFKPRNEGTRAISTNASRLLGNSTAEQEIIDEEIRILYSKRSKLVHEGEKIWCAVGEEDDVRILRQFVRDSLKTIIPLQLSKDELIESLAKKCLSYERGAKQL